MLSAHKIKEFEPAEQAAENLAQQQQAIEEQLQSLVENQQEVDQEQAAIDADAQVLEEQIRKLAKEEAEIQQRKRALQHEASAIGDRRSEVMKRAKQIAEQRAALEQERNQLSRLHEEAVEEAERAAQEQAALEQVPEEAPPAVQAPAAEEQPKAGAERRTAKRVAVAVDVSFQTEHNFYMGLTENLSSGGLFVATYDNVPIGTELKFKIGLPDQPPIEATGIVRWIREYTPFTEDVAPGIGVQLVDLSEDDQRAINNFLAQRDPIFYEFD